MILVTGVSGHVGGEALGALLRQGYPAAGMVRSERKAEALPVGTPLRLANYDDYGSLLQAFDGISTLLFVSSDGEGRDVLRHYANVIDAAVGQQVSSIVFTSIVDVDPSSPFYYAPVYRDAERRLADSAIPAVILRCGLYSDFLLSHWLKPALSTGTLRLPVEAAQVAPISRSDVALAAAAAAASPSQHAGNIYELTGPRALSFHELAKMASEAATRPLGFSPCSPADYLKRAWEDLEDPWPHAFSSLCRSIAEGRYERVSEGCDRLLGRPATDFAKFVRQASLNCP